MGLRTRLKSKAKAIASRVVHRHDIEQSTSEPIATPEEELMALEAEIEPAVELGPDLVEPEVAPSVEAEAEVAQAPRPPKREDEEAKAIQGSGGLNDGQGAIRDACQIRRGEGGTFPQNGGDCVVRRNG